MKLAINSIVFVAAVVLAGCEKKVEAPVVVDAGAAEKPACCETPAAPVDTDGGTPVAPLTAPTALIAPSTVVPSTPVATNPAAAPAAAAAPVAAPTTTIKK